MESEEEDDDEQGGHSLVGFMFGNVDKDMRLQEDYLDKARLSQTLESKF